jgi:glutaredoxin-related protein
VPKITPRLSLTSSRFSAADADQSQAGTKGAPPVSIDDLYGLCFLAEPPVVAQDRLPKDMFNHDLRVNEVVIYLNGGLHACKDKVNEDFVRHMFESHVIFFPRDAGKRPELRQILKDASGTEELPQLWVQKKLVGKGEELAGFERVWELCAPARRPWPRQGPYRQGFYNKPGVTQSDKIHYEVGDEKNNPDVL